MNLLNVSLSNALSALFSALKTFDLKILQFKVRFNYEFLDDEYSCFGWTKYSNENESNKNTTAADEEKDDKARDPEIGVSFLNGCRKVNQKLKKNLHIL